MGHSPVSASTPRCTIWPLVGPTGSRRPSHSPTAAVQAPPATASAAHSTLWSPSTLDRRRRGARRPRPATTPCTAPARRSARRAPRRPAGARPAMPRPSTRADGRVQRAVHRAERREERARLLRRDLGHLARRAAQHEVGEGGEPLVLVLAQADGEDPAGAVARARHVGAVGGRGAPAAPGSARPPGAGTARARRRSRSWSRARGCPAPASVARPGCAASTTVTHAPRQASS